MTTDCKVKRNILKSRGLYKPVEVIEKKLVEQLEATLPTDKKTLELVTHNDWLGTVYYTQYNHNKKLE